MFDVRDGIQADRGAFRATLRPHEMVKVGARFGLESSPARLEKVLFQPARLSPCRRTARIGLSHVVAPPGRSL